MVTITLDRERIDVVKGDESYIIGSNRIVLELPHVVNRKNSMQTFVVRGWSLSGTLRIVVEMIAAMRRYGSITEAGVIERWTEDWMKGLAVMDRSKSKMNWMVVYGEEEVLFRTAPTPELDVLEAVARGQKEITPIMQRRAQNKLGVTSIKVNSELAFEFKDMGWGGRVMVIDRSSSQDDKIEFTIPRTRGVQQADQWHSPLIAVRASSLLVECSALVSEFRRLSQKKTNTGNETLEHTTVRRQEIEERVTLLQSRLNVITSSNALNMRTRFPNYGAEILQEAL